MNIVMNRESMAIAEIDKFRGSNGLIGRLIREKEAQDRGSSAIDLLKRVRSAAAEILRVPRMLVTESVNEVYRGNWLIKALQPIDLMSLEEINTTNELLETAKKTAQYFSEEDDLFTKPFTCAQREQEEDSPCSVIQKLPPNEIFQKGAPKNLDLLLASQIFRKNVEFLCSYVRSNAFRSAKEVPHFDEIFFLLAISGAEKEFALLLDHPQCKSDRFDYTVAAQAFFYAALSGHYQILEKFKNYDLFRLRPLSTEGYAHIYANTQTFFQIKYFPQIFWQAIEQGFTKTLKVLKTSFPEVYRAMTAEHLSLCLEAIGKQGSLQCLEEIRDHENFSKISDFSLSEAISDAEKLENKECAQALKEILSSRASASEPDLKKRRVEK